jgi:radical SAM superfamily enzyme YgiQ (UPF0313 family)
VLVYGMGEKQILAIAKSLEDARGASYRTPSGLQDASLQDALTGYSLEAIPQIAYLTNNNPTPHYTTLHNTTPTKKSPHRGDFLFFLRKNLLGSKKKRNFVG